MAKTPIRIIMDGTISQKWLIKFYENFGTQIGIEVHVLANSKYEAISAAADLLNKAAQESVRFVVAEPDGPVVESLRIGQETI